MKSNKPQSVFPRKLLLSAALIAAAPLAQAEPEQRAHYIIQGAEVEALRTAVAAVGGEVLRELKIISAVGASLTANQLETLLAENQLRAHQDQRVKLNHAKGESTDAQAGSDASCALTGFGEREFKDKKIKWEIENQGGANLVLSSLSASWPRSNGELKKIKGGAELFKGKMDAPVATMASGWKGKEDDRTVKPGETLKLELEFANKIETAQDAYALTARFGADCAVTLEPLNEATDTKGVDKKARVTRFPAMVGADLLHRQGITGAGVGVAVLDTGLWHDKRSEKWLEKDISGDVRAVSYNAIDDKEGDLKKVDDKHGHGTHLASLIASSRRAEGADGSGKPNGIAPDATLVVVKAFDDDGAGTYMDVIRGIEWVVNNRDEHNIRVLNLSFSAPPQSHYWDDPMNQAVMAAWESGIVVVASAGNSGPAPMTIGVPGNVPYVITVGAMTDNRTAGDRSDDRLTSFYSAGPTHEGFVKPEVVAPGGRLLGILDSKGRIAKAHPAFHDGDSYYYMSGTSQSAAVVSGVAALLLQAEPDLTPDQVKCKLMSTARPAIDADGKLAYSVFQQGAGLVNAPGALAGENYFCGNQGLDVVADRAGQAHFRGPANQREDGSYFIEGLSEQVDSGYVWEDGVLWADGFLWSNAQTASVNGWVPQE